MSNEDLRYRIGGDTSGIDAAWAKIKRDAAATGSTIGAAMGRAESSVKGIQTALMRVPALLAALGATAIVSTLRDTAASVADIGRQAKRAGLDVESFQELAFVASQNGIAVDALTDGLKEMNLRADEFIATGAGPGREAFGRLGFSAEELAAKLKDPSALFAEIIGRLGKLDTAARIRIADEIFGGTAGERFVELTDLTEENIIAIINRAHELGGVFEKDVVDKATELDRKFDDITTAVGNGLKLAIVSAAEAMQNFINVSEGMWTRYEQRKKAVELGELAGSLAGQPFEGPAPALSANTTLKTDRLAKAEWTPGADTSVLDFMERYRQQLALTSKERQIAAETERLLAEASADGVRLTQEQALALAQEKVARDEAEKSRTAGSKASDREAEAIRRVIEELEHELATLGLSETEREVANALRRAGAAAASEEGQKIAELVRLREAEKTAIEKVKEADDARGEAFENLFQMGADGLTSLVDGTLDAEDAMKKLVIQLGLAVAQAALLNQGPLAGLFGGGAAAGGFGSILSGLFRLPGLAGGGYTGNGGTNQVSGVVHGREFVTNARATEQYRPILEAMNAGRDLGMFAAAPPQLSGPVQRPAEIALVSRFDADGGFDTAVERVAGPVSQRAAASAAGRVAQAVPSISAQSMDEGRTRRIRPRGGF